MEVLKIVSIEQGNYVSLVGTTILGNLARRYSVGDFTYPETGTFLYAYDPVIVERNAIFEDLERNQAVLLCEADVVESTQLQIPCLSMYGINASTSEIMWKHYLMGLPDYYTCSRGAVACKWIKPIKIVRDLRRKI